ncbi:MAG: glycosyltransferase [Cyanophyceae cyanobacterium]
MTKEYLPQVSVIVPIYNGEADVPGLIECLRSQIYPAERVEYLLVDNNSSDRTAALLAEAQSSDFEMRPLSEKIQSSYAARNRGIRSASSSILAFTDADCRPQPDWLDKLVPPFANPSVGIVVGEVVALPGATLLEKYAECAHLLSQKFLVEHPFCPYGQTANLAVRRQAFEEVGLFRPHLTTGGDADMCWRILRQTQWQLEFAPDAIVRHRHRSSLRSFKSQWQRYGRSNVYLHQLHGVNLMRELTWRESLYRLSRWLVKELPSTSLRAIAGKAQPVELLKTPIDLIGYRARTTGQRQAKLPEAAQEIEWF